MKSPLENKPKILEKIGLFIVLFNLIDTRLGIEFYYLVNQSDTKKRPVLDFLIAQDFAKRLDMLKLILGDDLYHKIKRINEFRTFIVHGFYEMDSSEKISITKIKRGAGKYHSVDDLSEDVLDKHIQNERGIFVSFHELTLKRMPK